MTEDDDGTLLSDGDVRRAAALAAHRATREWLGVRAVLDDAHAAGAGAGLAVGVAEVLRLLVSEFPPAEAQALIRLNRERRAEADADVLVLFDDDDLRRADALLHHHLAGDEDAVRAVLAEARADAGELFLAVAALDVVFQVAPGLDGFEVADALAGLAVAAAGAEARELGW